MGKLRVKAKTYKRGAWTDRYGHHHPATTIRRGSYLTKDRGKKGRTPKSERWFEPREDLNWSKDMSIKERREVALQSRNGDALATARALQALANVTADKETKKKARADAEYFFRLHRKE